jgi:DNA modification methylase
MLLNEINLIKDFKISLFILNCILSYKNDIILDPFNGSGTSCVAAEILGRRWIGIELSPNYAEISRKRIQAFVDDKKQSKLEFEKGI